VPSGADPEVPLTGGWVTSGVVRVGETVRRPVADGATFRHALLRHLEDVGFDGAPRLLGLDEEGREILTFIEGSVPSNCGSIVWDDLPLAAAAMLLRAFHDASAGSELAGSNEIVCHHDFGPWNLVWRDLASRVRVPVGIIDFDSAAPGQRVDDLGYAIWKHLNLGLIDLAPEEQGRRIGVMVSAYGAAFAGDVLPAIGRAQERMQRTVEGGTLGEGRSAALAQLNGERAWLEAHFDELQRFSIP
jgi:Phosphotransferase enzyme family